MRTQGVQAVTGRTEDSGQFILRAMVAIAASDGEIDARETAAIAQIFEDVTGKSIDEDAVAAAIDARQERGATGLLSSLSASAGRLSRETKERIMRAAYLVLLADDAITSQERKRLKEIAAALQIPEVHFGAIMEDVAIWLADRHRR